MSSGDRNVLWGQMLQLGIHTHTMTQETIFVIGNIGVSIVVQDVGY